MEVKKSGTQRSRTAPSANFTGSVTVDPLFETPQPSRARGNKVTFAPGARTHWHTHPLGQTLIIVEGSGFVQSWGGPMQAVQPGDVVWFPPGEKHWHGASHDTKMSHIAIGEMLDGRSADWLEEVSEAQYGGWTVPPSPEAAAGR